MCFIGAMYNTPTVNGGDVQKQLDQLVIVLVERGLYYNHAQVSADCAGSNVGYTRWSATFLQQTSFQGMCYKSMVWMAHVWLLVNLMQMEMHYFV
jgi:hypothetical protein